MTQLHPQPSSATRASPIGQVFTHSTIRAVNPSPPDRDGSTVTLSIPQRMASDGSTWKNSRLPIQKPLVRPLPHSRSLSEPDPISPPITQHTLVNHVLPNILLAGNRDLTSLNVSYSGGEALEASVCKQLPAEQINKKQTNHPEQSHKSIRSQDEVATKNLQDVAPQVVMQYDDDEVEYDCPDTPTPISRAQKRQAYRSLVISSPRTNLEASRLREMKDANDKTLLARKHAKPQRRHESAIPRFRQQPIAFPPLTSSSENRSRSEKGESQSPSQHLDVIPSRPQQGRGRALGLRASSIPRPSLGYAHPPRHRYPRRTFPVPSRSRIPVRIHARNDREPQKQAVRTRLPTSPAPNPVPARTSAHGNLPRSTRTVLQKQSFSSPSNSNDTVIKRKVRNPTATASLTLRPRPGQNPTQTTSLSTFSLRSMASNHSIFSTPGRDEMERKTALLALTKDGPFSRVRSVEELVQQRQEVSLPTKGGRNKVSSARAQSKSCTGGERDVGSGHAGGAAEGEERRRRGDGGGGCLSVFAQLWKKSEAWWKDKVKMKQDRK